MLSRNRDLHNVEYFDSFGIQIAIVQIVIVEITVLKNHSSEETFVIKLGNKTDQTPFSRLNLI